MLTVSEMPDGCPEVDEAAADLLPKGEPRCRSEQVLSLPCAELSAAALRKTYLACLGPRALGSTAKLAQIIGALVRRGATRATLVRWAVEAGCSEKYVRSLLSRIFIRLGLRRRRPGAGRRSSPEILQLLAEFKARFGQRRLKVARALWRAAEADEPACPGPSNLLLSAPLTLLQSEISLSNPGADPSAPAVKTLDLMTTNQAHFRACRLADVEHSHEPPADGSASYSSTTISEHLGPKIPLEDIA